MVEMVVTRHPLGAPGRRVTQDLHLVPEFFAFAANSDGAVGEGSTMKPA